MSPFRRLPVLLATFLLPIVVLVAACGDDGPSGPPAVADVAIVDGDGETVPVGSQIILLVRVTDASQQPIEGVVVAWSVTSGGGSLSAAETETTADGTATTTWTLGTGAGQQTVRALAGGEAATFTANAEPGAPDELTVTPSARTLTSFGETVQLSTTVTDENGNPIPGAAVNFVSDDGTVASVDGDGLVTAEGDGVATITASSGALEDEATITVAQEAATLVPNPTEVTVTVGGAANVAVSAEDANGNAVAGATFTWSADPAAPVGLAPNGDGSEVTVTGVAEGETTLTATSNETPAVSVDVPVTVEPSQEFEPMADVEVSGTLDVTTVVIPAGVTVTATDDLTILASDMVTIAGTLTGDCVDITVDGQLDVTITGEISNGCVGDPEADGRPMNLFAGGALNFDGSEITASGDLLVTNDPGEIPGPARSSGPAGVATGMDCEFRGVIFAWGPAKAPMDTPGGSLGVKCNGAATFVGGNQFFAQSGGDGTSQNQPTTATGNIGQDGGGVRLEANGDMLFQNEMINGVDGTDLRTGSGGDGGNATSTGVGAGGDATANGGNGGLGGQVSIQSLNGEITIDGLGAIGIQYGNGGVGGDATATAIDGGSAPTEGGNAEANAGDGGSAGGGSISDIGNEIPGLTNILQSGGNGGTGGDATVYAGRGGDGVPGEINGADGGTIDVFGGDGGDSVDDVSLVAGLGSVVRSIGDGAVGNGGDAGSTDVSGGQGGNGFPGCMVPFSQGGDGGDGRTATGNPGTPGTGLTDGADGTETVMPTTADGGAGADGVGPGAGGAGGLNLLEDSHPDSFNDGPDGGPCPFGFNVEIVVTSDPNGHEPFIQATSVNMIFFDVTEPGKIVFQGTTAWGQVMWMGTLGTQDGNTIPFTSSGTGTVAGFPNVPHTFDGSLTVDQEGKIVAIEGELVLDSTNSNLPPNMGGMRNPAVYDVTGTIKPES